VTFSPGKQHFLVLPSN